MLEQHNPIEFQTSSREALSLNLDLEEIKEEIQNESYEKLGSGIYYDVYDLPDRNMVIKVPNPSYRYKSEEERQGIDAQVVAEHHTVVQDMQEFLSPTEFIPLRLYDQDLQVVLQRKEKGISCDELDLPHDYPFDLQLNEEFTRFCKRYKVLRLKGSLIESNQFMINFENHTIRLYDTNEIDTFAKRLEAPAKLLSNLHIVDGKDIDEFWDQVGVQIPVLDPKMVQDQAAFLFQLQSYTPLFDQVLETLKANESPTRNNFLKQDVISLFSLLSKYTPSSFEHNLQTLVLQARLRLNRPIPKIREIN